MQIHVRRTKEPTKGLLSGKNWKLSSSISVSLSDDEQVSVKEYYDPNVDYNTEILNWSEAEQAGFLFKNLEFEQKSKSLSSFDLRISAGKHDNLGAIQHVERAAVEALTAKLKHLQNLAKWEGEETVESD